MSDKNRAKKLAAAKKKLKEYHGFREKKDSNEGDNGCHVVTLLKKSGLKECTVEQVNFDALEKEYGDGNSDVIETLVSEKANILTQLVKIETISKAKEMEIEELNAQLSAANKRIENLGENILGKTVENDDLKITMVGIRNELNRTQECNKKIKSKQEEQEDYIKEMKNNISVQQRKIEELESELKDKTYELELNKIRISQLSDEAHITIDNKVETLTQSKFAYEQEISNLQGVIEQLRKEKDECNQQYQNYIQNLSKELSVSTEKNLQIKEENTKLVEREKYLVQHIQELEKQIQHNIIQQDSFLESKLCNSNEVAMLEENISKLEKERAELLLSVKSKEEKLLELNKIIQEKEERILELEKGIKNYSVQRPNDEKILATIESDKIAASRAVAQNEELKKQLIEVELKLVQVTNEKVELVHSLQSVQHINKEFKSNFDYLKENVNKLHEQLGFKDEEMIRLTHENNDLKNEIQGLNNRFRFRINDKVSNVRSEAPKELDDAKLLQSYNHHENACVEELNVDKDCIEWNNQRNEVDFKGLPQEEAMHKLEERLKKLMDKVVDLNDEKQNLEHLVLQLQSETETIGDYITLYQTQRRILKQKEIDRNLQIQKLITERETVKQKALQLINLVNNFNLVEFERSKNSGNHFSLEAREKAYKEMLTDIQKILLDFNKSQSNNGEQLKVTLDHCACCSGKFETI